MISFEQLLLSKLSCASVRLTGSQ